MLFARPPTLWVRFPGYRLRLKTGLPRFSIAHPPFWPRLLVAFEAKDATSFLATALRDGVPKNAPPFWSEPFFTAVPNPRRPCKQRQTP